MSPRFSTKRCLSLIGVVWLALGCVTPRQSPSPPPFITFSRIDAAWEQSRGAGVTVAVLDWQFDLGREAADKYVDPTSLIPDQGIGELEPWHGEWMAELAHAVAPEAKIMPIRARPLCENDDPAKCGPRAYANYAIEGIRLAADHGAVAVTSSMGPLAHSPELLAAVDYAESKGTLFIDVHPEDVGGDPESYTPCDPGVCSDKILHSGIVSVPDHPTEPEAARDVYTWPYEPDPVFRDGWGYSNGPPIIAGVVALMKSVNQGLTPSDVKEIIVGTAEMRDGFAVLDGEAAVREALARSKE